MKVSREIAIYKKNGEQFIIDFKFNLSRLQLFKILENTIAEDDKEIHQCYQINLDQYNTFSKIEPELLQF